MSVNFTSVKCPECGASLPIEEGRTQVFCSYCGTKVIVTNDNEYIYRHIDEAGVKQAETDRMIRLRQLELEEAQAQQNAKLRSTLMKIWIPVSGIIILIERRTSKVHRANGVADERMDTTITSLRITGALSEVQVL